MNLVGGLFSLLGIFLIINIVIADLSCPKSMKEKGGLPEIMKCAGKLKDLLVKECVTKHEVTKEMVDAGHERCVNKAINCLKPKETNWAIAEVERCAYGTQPDGVDMRNWENVCPPDKQKKLVDCAIARMKAHLSDASQAMKVKGYLSCLCNNFLNCLIKVVKEYKKKN